MLLKDEGEIHIAGSAEAAMREVALQTPDLAPRSDARDSAAAHRTSAGSLSAQSMSGTAASFRA